MLRGVKKQIVEVVNTENEYFEKAILVVSEKYIECDKQKLNKKAKEYVSSINPFNSNAYSQQKKGKDRVKILLSVIKYFAFSSFGAMIAYFIIK